MLGDIFKVLVLIEGAYFWFLFFLHDKKSILQTIQIKLTVIVKFFPDNFHSDRHPADEQMQALHVSRYWEEVKVGVNDHFDIFWICSIEYVMVVSVRLKLLADLA